MPRHGSKGDCRYRLQKWDINSLAYEYKLILNGQTKLVYVDTLTELKNAIAHFISEQYRYGIDMDD